MLLGSSLSTRRSHFSQSVANRRTGNIAIRLWLPVAVATAVSLIFRERVLAVDDTDLNRVRGQCGETI